jgi:hypothetical protein
MMDDGRCLMDDVQNLKNKKEFFMKSTSRFILLIVLFSANFVLGQEVVGDWKFSGQIQLRSEVDGRDFRNETHPLTFASLRSRVGVEKTFMDKVNFFVQIQDSRVFGEEGNTLASIDNIDLHQGYVVLKKIFDWNLDVQAGRFELIYGTERFFGAVGWHYVGRAWDGVRFKYNCNFNFDLFALTQHESVQYIGNAIPSVYPSSVSPTPSFSVYGFWGTFNSETPNRIDLFGYLEADRRKSDDVNNLNKYTIGANHFGNYGMINTIFEGGYQFGEITGLDISAYLLSLQVNLKKNNWKFGLGGDLISGNDNEGSYYNTFSPSYGTNHKFYGYMDYFINIPGNTFRLGLNDFYAKIFYQPDVSKFSGSVDIHHFTSNQFFPKTTTSGSEVIEVSSFGQEIDVTIKYNFIKGTTLTWGGSAFIPGEFIRIFFLGGTDVAFWSYVMITASI